MPSVPAVSLPHNNGIRRRLLRYNPLSFHLRQRRDNLDYPLSEAGTSLQVFHLDWPDRKVIGHTLLRHPDLQDTSPGLLLSAQPMESQPDFRCEAPQQDSAVP